MYCSRCGSKNSDGVAFCANCGAPFQKEWQGNPGNAGHAQAGSHGRAPLAAIRKRNIVMCIVFSIVTCGIYGLYWLCCLANDVNEASDHRSDTSGGMVVVFSIITCNIYMMYWAYITGGKVSEIKQRYEGRADDSLKIIYLLLVIFGLGIIQYALLQNELNKIAAYG